MAYSYSGCPFYSYSPYDFSVTYVLSTHLFVRYLLNLVWMPARHVVHSAAWRIFEENELRFAMDMMVHLAY
jgi:hypothetical protein